MARTRKKALNEEIESIAIEISEKQKKLAELKVKKREEEKQLVFNTINELGLSVPAAIDLMKRFADKEGNNSNESK